MCFRVMDRPDVQRQVQFTACKVGLSVIRAGVDRSSPLGRARAACWDPLVDHLQQVQPQVHPIPGQLGTQVQMMQVQFALPQFALVCSADFIGVFMASLVLIVRRHKSPRTCCGACYTNS